ncbi:hypothetical protein B1R44_10590 [Serratia marcescens]|nr:hypothetical protein B1R44_10590 [Serratia marcescens]
MFELGMRLAFDKPTVIVKDEKTPYSFDISSIEHLEYPSDLRYQAINEFKAKLAGKISETHKRATTDPEYTTFLKHFGTFKVAKLDEKEVGANEIFLEELKEIKRVLNNVIKNDNNIEYIKKNSFPRLIIKEHNFKSTNKYSYQFREPNLGDRFDEFINIIERFDRAHAMGFSGADKIDGDSATVFYNRPQNEQLLESMRMEVAQYFA